MRHTARWWGGLVLAGGVAGGALAQVLPQPLQGWQDWVLHGHEQQACPLLVTSAGTNPDNRQCVWPGRLALTADKSGARFQLRVGVDAESWVELPGSREAWPQQVLLDGRPAVVLDRGGTPALRLATGEHSIQGAFQWEDRPARVRVPAAIALVDLTVDGVALEQPERADGSLTLGAAAARQRQADALTVRVFRRLDDGSPPMLDTAVLLHVAGSAREALLGPTLPRGFVATGLDGDLPARLDPDGRLRVQLRPGDWQLRLTARGTAPLGKLGPQAVPAPWPAQEIWSYADAPDFRTTRAEGAQPIDPAQAGVPDDWRRLPAFVLAAGSLLDIRQRARGLAGGTGDRLRLQRALWLDFDGRGLTADDHLVGTLRDADRLDVASPWVLDAAAQDAGGSALLVTRGGQPDLSGVEVRTRVLAMRAGLRLASHGRAQSATGGWQRTLDGVEATLHLPYGYRLLGAPGADRSPDSWVARWNVLDLFVAALVALLAWRLLGWMWAILTAAYVVLSHAEPGAPLWAPALVLALGLSARMLPAGALRKVARAGGGVALIFAVLGTLPFAAVQVRDALYPQLEGRGLAWIAPERAAAAQRAVATEFLVAPFTAAKREIVAPQEQTVMAAPAPPPPAQVMVTAGSPSMQTIVLNRPQPSATDVIATAGYPPDSVVQSGGGVPAWAGYGSTYRLGWSGPVTVQQSWRMVVLPGWATRVLRIVMLALLVAWLVALARAMGLGNRSGVAAHGARTGAIGLLLLLALAPAARAQTTPSTELLSELRTRLLEAPRCMPDCAAAPLAEVALRADLLQVTLTVNAAARVAFPLPRMDAPAALRGITLDGRLAADLASRDGNLWIALERGVHRVSLDFRLPADMDGAIVHFPLPPPAVQVVAPGWQLSGVDGTHLLSDTLAFARERAAGSRGTRPAPAQVFPPFVQLTRSVVIGLDSRVDNVAVRLAPVQGGFTVGVPLLPGEHVSDAAFKVEAGRVQVTFGPDQHEARWSSTLDAAPTLTLRAPAWTGRAEVWRIASTPLLHLAFEGVPESTGGDAGARVFRPLPGETLAVRVTRPAAVPGTTAAIDRVALDVTRGERALDANLALQVRSTRGGEQSLTLPRDAQLLGAQRDGRALELTVRDGRVALPVQPGVQTFNLKFREAGTLGLLTRTPQVSLGADAANVSTGLDLPLDRWVLWTWGPQAGPAVLYWPQLVVLLIVAIALARLAPTPLRWWHWLLLGLGFSTFAWSAFAVVAAWLVVLGWRARSDRIHQLTHTPFDVLQVLIAVLTGVALVCLVASVPYGLLGHPDMRIAGVAAGSRALQWFTDRTQGAVPPAGALTLPLWAYRLAMLAWALWLANALIGWLRWGFRAWARGGYWKRDDGPHAPAASAPPSE